MKTIGLIGGMSWESSLEYYRIINETVKKRLGGLHSGKCLMYSVDFQEIEALQHSDQWEKVSELLTDIAMRLERGGADVIVICTNTMHKLADEIEDEISIPLLHIADATGQRIMEMHNVKMAENGCGEGVGSVGNGMEVAQGEKGRDDGTGCRVACEGDRGRNDRTGSREECEGEGRSEEVIENSNKMRRPTVGLLGTNFTMEEDFYSKRLNDKFGIEVLIPPKGDRMFIHHVIYNELCLGTINGSSRTRFVDIINDLKERGAHAIILGCTEIPLLVKDDDTNIPLIDTTRVHAEAAVEFALGSQNDFK